MLPTLPASGHTLIKAVEFLRDGIEHGGVGLMSPAGLELGVDGHHVDGVIERVVADCPIAAEPVGHLAPVPKWLAVGDVATRGWEVTRSTLAGDVVVNCGTLEVRPTGDVGLGDKLAVINPLDINAEVRAVNIADRAEDRLPHR